MKMSPKLQEEALKALHALAKAIEALGHKVEIAETPASTAALSDTEFLSIARTHRLLIDGNRANVGFTEYQAPGSRLYYAKSKQASGLLELSVGSVRNNRHTTVLRSRAWHATEKKDIDFAKAAPVIVEYTQAAAKFRDEFQARVTADESWFQARLALEKKFPSMPGMTPLRHSDKGLKFTVETTDLKFVEALLEVFSVYQGKGS